MVAAYAAEAMPQQPKIHRVSPNISFVERGWSNSNTIVVYGNGTFGVIDTGHPADVAETLALLEAAGVTLAQVSLVVNTHCHWDHFGATDAVRALSGAPLAVSAATADIFARRDRRALWFDYFGVDFLPPKPADRCWSPGETVRVAGLPFEVLAAPGHAPDGIALYQPDQRLLISADALHERDCGVINVAVHGEEALDAALDTVARFMRCDVALALPGHGPAITDVTASLQALQARLERFRREPRRLALHLARRVTMAALLEMQPVRREQFLATTAALPWVADYAPRCGAADARQFVAERLEAFERRGLVRQEGNHLLSTIPR